MYIVQISMSPLFGVIVWGAEGVKVDVGWRLYVPGDKAAEPVVSNGRTAMNSGLHEACFHS